MSLVLLRRPPATAGPRPAPTQTWTSRHRADRAGLDQLDDAAVVVAGVDLGAHLRGDLGLGGGLADDAGLPDVVVSGFSQ